MRTNTNANFTNRTVFGLGQDRVVLSRNVTYVCAAQHLSRHASKRDRDVARGPKRRGYFAMLMASAPQMIDRLIESIWGPQWRPVRLSSPVLVTL